jgi:hypothetical protein
VELNSQLHRPTVYNSTQNTNNTTIMLSDSK